MPRLAASLMKAWSSVSRSAITGQVGAADYMVDQVERVRGSFLRADQRDVGPLPGGDGGDVLHIDRAGDHFVTEADDDRRHMIEPGRALIGD